VLVIIVGVFAVDLFIYVIFASFAPRAPVVGWLGDVSVRVCEL
jgi:hypothetical protein